MTAEAPGPAVRVGLIGAGEMGSAIGALLTAAGHAVHSVLGERSARTRARAQAAGIAPAPDLPALLDLAQVLLCVVPPGAARTAARQCASGLRAGQVYVDLNAVAPATARDIGAVLAASGAVFVDGGIVGPAPRERAQARLYLSGPRPPELVALAGALDLRWVGDAPGLASALKLCFAASTKAVSALHLTLLAAAEQAGVRAALMDEFALSQPALAARLAESLPMIPARAARWSDEMAELAALLEASELPNGAARAAATVFAHAARTPWANRAPDDRSGRPALDDLVRACSGTGAGLMDRS